MNKYYYSNGVFFIIIKQVKNNLTHVVDKINITNKLFDLFDEKNEKVFKYSNQININIKNEILSHLEKGDYNIDISKYSRKCAICDKIRNNNNEWKLIANPNTYNSELLCLLFPFILCEKCFRENLVYQENIIEVGIAVLPSIYDVGEKIPSSTRLEHRVQCDSVSGMQTMIKHPLTRTARTKSLVVFSNNRKTRNLNFTPAVNQTIQTRPQTLPNIDVEEDENKKLRKYSQCDSDIMRGKYCEDKLGYLLKRSQGFIKKFKTVYIYFIYSYAVLSGHYLLIFHNPEENTPKRVINIKNSHIEHSEEHSNRQMTNVFTVTGKEKDKEYTYIFASVNNSIQDEYDWINALQTNANK